MQDLVRKGEAVVHIVPTTANYLRFLAILVSGAYGPGGAHAPANTVDEPSMKIKIYLSLQQPQRPFPR